MGKFTFSDALTEGGKIWVQGVWRILGSQEGTVTLSLASVQVGLEYFAQSHLAISMFGAEALAAGFSTEGDR